MIWTNGNVTRRRAMSGLAAAWGSTAIATAALALVPRPALAMSDLNAPIPEGDVFSFDLLTEAMRRRAEAPDPEPPAPPPLLPELDYDDYRKIVYRQDASRWADQRDMVRLQAFHSGWLFPNPVATFDVSGGTAQPMVFTTSDFEYHIEGAERIEPDTPLAGIAGFRLLAPLNLPDRFDEIVAFLGASYFRALGQGNFYGASARGLALDTATSQQEEFPRFSAFYLERPAPGVQTVVINAALDSPSATGAYRFVITPGPRTTMEVTARLYFRRAVEELGIAPLTSMFFFDETSHDRFADFRPQVHDSDGLGIRRQSGSATWRALANPPSLAGSYFRETSLAAYGLYQRDREFDEYQDAEARYEKRPSIEVQPIGEWGPGHVRLVEIPTDEETNDNIVAFWVPDAKPEAGTALEYRYNLHWGALSPEAENPLAHVVRTASGPGGNAVDPDERLRKFVVDFTGGRLAELDGDAELTPELRVQGAKASEPTLALIEGTGLWRMTFDIELEGRKAVELVGWVSGYDQTLTELWAYQWIPT